MVAGNLKPKPARAKMLGEARQISLTKKPSTGAAKKAKGAIFATTSISRSARPHTGY